jgi:hypothetical protein
LPEGGERKYREKIRKESKFVDDHKNLPFTFSKPRRLGKQALFKCLGCGHTFFASKNTVMCICSECKKAMSVECVNE